MIETKEDAIRWLAEHGGRIGFRVLGDPQASLSMVAEVKLDDGQTIFAETSLASKWIESNLSAVIKNCVGQLISRIEREGLRLAQ